MSKFIVGEGRTLYRQGQSWAAGRPVPQEILTAWGKGGIEKALEAGTIVDTSPPVKARARAKANDESARTG